MDNNRNKFINFRASPAEVKMLHLMAEQESRNTSEMLRELIRREAERRGILGYVVTSTNLEATQP